MNFLTLFNRLSKQPIKNTRNSDIIAVFTYEDLAELLKNKQPNYEIPLDLKFGNGTQKMWFILAKNKKI